MPIFLHETRCNILLSMVKRLLPIMVEWEVEEYSKSSGKKKEKKKNTNEKIAAIIMNSTSALKSQRFGNLRLLLFHSIKMWLAGHVNFGQGGQRA